VIPVRADVPHSQLSRLQPIIADGEAMAEEDMNIASWKPTPTGWGASKAMGIVMQMRAILAKRQSPVLYGQTKFPS
jgi:hypothetical protein